MENDYPIFLKCLVFQIENSISIENLGFRSKNPVFQIKIFETLSFSHIEFEILNILSEMLNISRT